MEDDQQFCLRWNNHQSTLISVFDTLLENGTLVDCTLAAEGKFLKAHKVVLSACSPYFATLLTQQYDKHPVFILKDVKFQELRAMMDYMYRGEVNISQDQLAALLRAAESLQIKGLSDNRGGSGSSGGGGGGVGGSGGGDSGSKNENAQQKPIPVPVVSKPGLTIEQKRPNKHPAVIDAELCESREGSTSPTSRKRKKIRRRSTETNNLVDNHDQLSNSSSQSMPHHQPQQQTQQQQNKHVSTSSSSSTVVASLPQITSATSAANVLNVTKKTDIHEPKKELLDQSMQKELIDDEEDDDDDDENEIQEPPIRRLKSQQQHHDIDIPHLKEKLDSTHSELLIEPKSEYDDVNDETVEDLTLDEEELLEDLDQAGPSHGGEGSSQGYAQWQVDRSQDEVFLAAQEAAGQHRDAQESFKIPIDDTLLESDEINISRRGNSFVLTKARTMIKKPKLTLGKMLLKRNGAGVNVKKIGNECALYPLKDPLSLESTKEIKMMDKIKQEKEAVPNVTVLSRNNKKIEIRRFTSLNQSLSLTPSASTSKANQSVPGLTASISTISASPTNHSPDEIEEYMEFAEITNISDINVADDELNMDGLLTKSGFQILTKESDDKYSIIETTMHSDGGDGGGGSGNSNRNIRKKFDIVTTGNDGSNSSFQFELASESSQTHSGDDEKKEFSCRHCGKKYRWKSTLRRHETVECGGKAPSYSCPYCDYKAKQRGNLGVHVRKHHAHLPQLPSRRKSNRNKF